VTQPAWIQTRDGGRFDLLDPDPALIDVEAIAHSLGMLCRFTGHVDRFLSVAQHSVLVSHLCPPEHALTGLLHDATEAFVGDVASPLKRLLPAYQEIEQRIWVAVTEAFDLPIDLPAEVKDADLRALYVERDHFMPRPPTPWEHEHISGQFQREGYPCAHLVRESWSPHIAKSKFLNRWHELMRADEFDLPASRPA
jgi:hypothetical protein